MTRQEIIADLMACLAAITPEHGFAIAPRLIRRGIHLVSQASQTPALCLFNERVETVDANGGLAERLMIMHLWGAVSTPGGEYAPLDALAAACLAVLGRPDCNPHWDRTHCQRLELFEGGASEPLSLFDLQFSVAYESPLATL